MTTIALVLYSSMRRWRSKHSFYLFVFILFFSLWFFYST